DSEIEDYLSKDPKVLELNARLERLKARVKYLEGIVVRSNEPSLQKARGDLEAAEESLNERRARVRKELAEGYGRRVRAEAEASIAEMQVEVDQLKEEEQALRTELQTTTGETAKTGARSVDLEMTQGFITLETKFFETIADQTSRAKMEME